MFRGNGDVMFFVKLVGKPGNRFIRYGFIDEYNAAALGAIYFPLDIKP